VDQAVADGIGKGFICDDIVPVIRGELTGDQGGTEPIDDALSSYGVPEIFNTDQGTQFTSQAFTDRLKEHDVAISMDGRGRVQDNIFIERLRWTLKYQYIYLWSFDNGSNLRRGLGEWFRFYNKERSHQALDYRTPNNI